MILDDTSLPKKGDKSVGVASVDCGTLGKVAHCQSVVTWHYSELKGDHFSIIAEFFCFPPWTNHKK